jgi:hypothetical protein
MSQRFAYATQHHGGLLICLEGLKRALVVLKNVYLGRTGSFFA